MTNLKQFKQEIQQINTLRSKCRPNFGRCPIILGIGKIVGYLIFISYFTVLPAIMKILWSHLFNNYESKIISVYVGSVFAINVGIFILYNTTLYAIYHLKHPFFEQYKNSDKPWPWEENPKEWRELMVRSVKTILINFFVVTPIMVYISIITSLPYEFSLKKWPSTFEIVWQFAFFLIVEDILFYFSHRLLHRPGWYWIHKYHHQYRQTISLAAHYVHPIEYILSGTLPSSLGFQILSFITNVHYSTVLVWLIYRMIQSYEGHSGYTWSWNTLSLFPYTVGSDYHDFHHAMNAGNYGSVFIFCDAIFKTQSPFIQFLEKQSQKKKKIKG